MNRGGPIVRVDAPRLRRLIPKGRISAVERAAGIPTTTLFKTLRTGTCRSDTLDDICGALYIHSTEVTA